MYEPEGKERESGAWSDREVSSHRETFGGYDFIGEADLENGEYHYRSGYTEKIYSDAHYVPADESTAPPRYYTPPERPVRQPRPSRVKRNSNVQGVLKSLCLCLVCAILGGAAGSAMMGRSLAGRVAGMEMQLNELRSAAQQPVTVTPAVAASGMTAAQSSEISAGQIYDRACQQVVGISAQVTYTNFFGTTSRPVSGSGFIISADGYIITNYHVIGDSYTGGQDIEVILHDGSVYEAAVVGFENDGSDVAVLKIDAAGLNPVTIGNSDAMHVGDDVYVVGNPLGELEFSQTQGHVSALNRLITTDSASSSIGMFQIDAAINSGNSGGPVYNAQGQVIGIVTAKYSDTGVEGLGFAIPINEAASIANDLITKGYVTGKASLGVTIDRRYNSMYSQYYGMPIGAYVDSVTRGSCAERAGLRTGDIITKLGDEAVSSYDELRSAIRQYNAGETAEITFYRAGQSLTVSVSFDEEQPDSGEYRASASHSTASAVA